MTSSGLEVSAPRPWFAAACTSAGCSALFIAVYSFCNQYAAASPHVSERWWTWELSIPLVKPLIVPYMSIDLLFALAPFLCTSRAEVLTLAGRFVAATLLAGICFLLWPLQVAFPRDAVDGVFAPIFVVLRGFDQPHNLFPSLHITLAFILRWTYHRHLNGIGRLAFHVWLLLISASTLLVHQHQVIDLLGGVVLAIVVFFLFPGVQREAYAASARGRALCLAYASASAAMTVTAAGMAAGSDGATSWALLLLWPALSLALIALGYGLAGTAIFAKHAGKPAFASRVLLAPWMAGLWVSRRWYWSREVSLAGEVVPGLYLGSLPRGAHACGPAAQATGIDLTAEHAAPRELRTSGHYVNVPMLDLVPPSRAALERAAKAISQAHGRGPVLVWCALGYGRSAAAVAAYLLLSGTVRSVDEAYSRIRAVRPRVVLRPEVRALLEGLSPGAGSGPLPTISPACAGGVGMNA